MNEIFKRKIHRYDNITTGIKIACKTRLESVPRKKAMRKSERKLNFEFVRMAIIRGVACRPKPYEE